MKAFWIKTISIVVIGIMIFMYQTSALSYSKMSKTIDALKAQIEEQQKQLRALARQIKAREDAKERKAWKPAPEHPWRRYAALRR